MMHDGATITFNTEDQSAASITAIAAYNAVSQRLDPIHSGYVVCLCYELRFLGRQESIPRLPDLAGARLQLLCIFRSWRQWLDFGAEDVDEDSDFDDDETPDCVACLCERTYDDGTAKFKATSLRGSDRLMLEHIAPLAKTYGFDLHLAHVTYKQSGLASFNSVRRRKWGGCECGGCSEDMVSSCDEDAADWSDVDVNKLEMTEDVESINFDLSILALDGMPMQMSGATVEAMKRQDGDMDNGYSGYLINGSLEHGDRKPSLKRERRTASGELSHTVRTVSNILTPTDICICSIQTYCSHHYSGGLANRQLCPRRCTRVCVYGSEGVFIGDANDERTATCGGSSGLVNEESNSAGGKSGQRVGHQRCC